MQHSVKWNTTSQILKPKNIKLRDINGLTSSQIKKMSVRCRSQDGFDYSLFFIGFMTAAILCRMLLAGYVVRLDPFNSLLVLTGLTLISIVLFMTVTTSSWVYLGAAAVLGIGYG